MNRILMRINCLLLFTCLSSSIFAAQVDTVETFSTVMHKKIKAVIIRPQGVQDTLRLPVVYLLHGYGGNYANWIKSVPQIAHLADVYQMMLVCPDGNVSSWYIDSPVDPSSKYETYITKELIPWIDSHYHTIKDRSGRSITGLSMGGHGALYLAFKHQKLFGAAGSMSGGVDIRPFPNNWDLPKRLGSLEESPENWNQHTVVNLIELIQDESLALLIDCGIDDFFFDVNRAFHEKLVERNIAHDYIVRPGGHSWKYWSNAVQYQLLFMHAFFNNQSN